MFNKIRSRWRSLQQRRKLKSISLQDAGIMSEISKRGLTYLSPIRLFNIVRTCREIEASGSPGIFIEAGCALGGSAILISTIKNKVRPFFIYDVFGMIPAPTKDDSVAVHDRYETIHAGMSSGIAGNKYYGYEEDLFGIVKNNLEDFGINVLGSAVFLMKGLVQETLLINEPVAFAHIDVDWYEPVKTCLTRIFPKLIVGGSIIVDDYHDWDGCRKATDEYLQTIPDQYQKDDSCESLRITKLR